MARRRLSLLAATLISSTLGAAHGSPVEARPACFGGIPQVAVEHEDDAEDVAVSGRFLTWSAGGRRRMDLATSKVSADPSAEKAKADRDRFEDLAPLRLSSAGPPVSARPFFYADAKYFYYHQIGPEYPIAVPAGDETGLFRVRRTGASAPEFLGLAPFSGVVVDHGFLYYLDAPSPLAPALVRRELAPGAKAEIVQHLAPAKQPRWRRPPIVRLVGGRAYFAHDEGLWSAPLDGSARPTRHAELGRGGALDLLVEGGCLYWVTEHAISRVAVDGGAPSAPEIIADEPTYQPRGGDVNGSPDLVPAEGRYLATDGRFLYWPDTGGDRIMRAARDERVIAPTPPIIAASLGPAAVLDAPPPSGTAWAPSCAIHSGCAQPTLALPACAANLAAEPWSKVRAEAGRLAGKVVTVSGPLTLGRLARGRGWKPDDRPHNGVLVRVRCKEGECCRQDPRPVELADGRDGLQLPSLECRGDDSRVCCPVPAFGQTVVATGTLKQVWSGRWTLVNPRLCVR
jgi:hypothetical protein